MIRAYLFALDPTDGQEQRFAYNWALAQVKVNWNQRQAEEPYGIADADRTPWINTSAYSLRKAWNQAKADIAPWWAENSKEAHASGCVNLSAALGNRRAERARMPRFKSKRAHRAHRAHRSCRFTTGAFGLGHRVVSAGPVARLVLGRTARRRRCPRSTQLVTGVDLGISALVTLSTGEKVTNPRHLDQAQRVLRRAGRVAARRQGPDRRTGQVPSNRWRKAQERVTRLHARVANQRRDGLHTLTTRLVREFDVIVIEDLHVAGMVRNRRLARHIADAGWGEFRRQLTYKADAAGVRVVVADRWFASSKTCSECGAAKAELALSERTYTCEACGLVFDRDHNAARNLAALVGGNPGELLREQPAGTRVRPGPAPGSETAMGRPRSGRRHARKDAAHGTELLAS